MTRPAACPRIETEFAKGLRAVVNEYVRAYKPLSQTEQQEVYFIGRALTDWEDFSPQSAVIGMLVGFDKASLRRKAAGEQ